MKKKPISKRRLMLKKNTIIPLNNTNSSMQQAATFNCWRTAYGCKS